MALNTVNGGANGKTATFYNDVYATTMNVSGMGTIAMTDGGDINGAVTTSTNGSGTWRFWGRQRCPARWEPVPKPEYGQWRRERKDSHVL